MDANKTVSITNWSPRVRKKRHTLVTSSDALVTSSFLLSCFLQCCSPAAGHCRPRFWCGRGRFGLLRAWHLFHRPATNSETRETMTSRRCVHAPRYPLACDLRALLTASSHLFTHGLNSRASPPTLFPACIHAGPTNAYTQRVGGYGNRKRSLASTPSPDDRCTIRSSVSDTSCPSKSRASRRRRLPHLGLHP